jgi:tetratricopeptide (TPR) repeat protein
MSNQPLNPLSELQADWPAISRLLDEALALPHSEREAWLDQLPATAAGLKDTLARLLGAGGGVETGDFMHTLPKLGAVADAGERVLAPAGAQPEPGSAVGPWRLLRELGEGGMGSVWLAERADGQLKRQVALKLPRLTWLRGLAERMARERDILATLEHPHIARLYDAGVDAHGRPWLALEYVQGVPIDAHARDRGLTVRQRVELLLQVCEAVAYAHSRLVIHRDLKPGNILVTGGGQVKLLDFGIAKLVEGDAAAAMGTSITELQGRPFTPAYASPEQQRGEPLTTASDVYSLGVVAHELLCGLRPVDEARAVRASAEGPGLPPASSRTRDPALRKALRGNLDAILREALIKDPARRTQSVDALAGDLARHLNGEPVRARAEGWAEQLQRTARRHRLPLGIAALLALAALGGAHAQAAVIVALGAGVLVATWQRREALRQAERARAEAGEAQRQRARAEAVKGFALGLFDAADVDSGGAASTTALQVLQRAQTDLKAAPPDDPATMLELSLALAQSLLGLDRPETALSVLDDAEHAVRARVATLDPLLAALALLRARALQQQSRFVEAMPVLDRVLGRQGVAAVQAAVALRLRALSRHALGQFPQAVDDLRQAVEHADASGDALELLLTLNEQTRVLGYVGHADRIASANRGMQAAARCDAQRHALPILQARQLFALGHCLQGDARAGLAEFASVIDHLERLLGPAHSRVCDARTAHSAALYQCGLAKEAIDCMRRSIAIEEQQGDTDTQALRLARMGLGGVLVNEGCDEEGLALLRQAMHECRRHEGMRHPLTITVLNRLVAALTKAGLLDEAARSLAELRALVESDARALDEWHFEQARWLRAVGRPAEALTVLSSIHERRLGTPSQLSVAAQWELLGGALGDAQRPAEAIEPLQKALAIYAGRQPHGSVGIARARLELGRARLDLGENDDAVRELREALQYWEVQAPASAPAAEAAGWLALAVHAAGDAQTARALALRAMQGPWRGGAGASRLRGSLLDCL